jgi:hypothetical protein
VIMWPELDELKQVLDITSEDWDGAEDEYDLGPTRLTRLLAAAIARVKRDVGSWDEYEDEPDESLAQAALRMAELMAARPESSTNDLSKDAAYQSHIHGHRRRFAIA